MSVSNLLSLDVDLLYEQHSVAEIDVVQRKILNVVENKREELRSMVGERYRDLLKAADTITTMQESSNKLIEQLQSIKINCRALNEQQLIGFKTNDSIYSIQNHNVNKDLNNYFNTMIQIKLLSSLPELIWSNIDVKCFFKATELFIFSRHIATGLQLDKQNKILQHCVVASKQWDTLKTFHHTLKKNITSVLEREDLNCNEAVDCMLSLMLLEKCNLNNVFKTFLKYRSDAFKNSLQDDMLNIGNRKRANLRILNSLKVLTGTIELMEKCFAENSVLFEKLKTLSDPHSSPTIMLMDSDDVQFSYMLPDVISNFRPKYKEQHLNKSECRTVLHDWIIDINNIADSNLPIVFELITTMDIIQDIRIEAERLCENVNYKLIIDKFDLSVSLDCYDVKYVPLINQRIHNIIIENWSNAMEDCFQNIQQKITGSSTFKADLWHESPDDLPLSLEKAVSEDKKHKKLLIKGKGYNNDIVEICEKFDYQLEQIISEIDKLIKEKTSKLNDKVLLIKILSETAEIQLTAFIKKIKKLNFQNNELLFVTKTCEAIIDLCFHLKICFCQQNSWSQLAEHLDENRFEKWDKICLTLESEILEFWSLIMDNVLSENTITDYMSDEIKLVTALEDFTIWDAIVLPQKEEDEDSTISSTIRIPNQARTSVQSYLFAVIHSLASVIPQALQLKLRYNFKNKLVLLLLSYYESLLNGNQKLENQTIALQLYFDILCIQGIFSINREERETHEKCQLLQQSFKELIDPFDFEIFYDYIIANVKTFVGKHRTQYGVLMTQSIDTSSSTPTITNVSEKDPNILTLSSNASTSIWFPLLPIVKPNPTIVHETVINKSMSPGNEKTSRKGAKPKSGASSFFEAMSQDWFR